MVAQSWGGVVKVGWQVHRCNPKDQGLQCPYIPLHFPLPSRLFMEEVDIQHCAWDTVHKFHNHFFQSGYRVLEMPPL